MHSYEEVYALKAINLRFSSIDLNRYYVKIRFFQVIK